MVSKEKRKEYRHAYYLKNKEKARAYAKEHPQKWTRERMLQVKAWRKRNPDKVKLWKVGRKRKRRRKKRVYDSAKIKVWSKRWRLNNPEKYRIGKRQSEYKRRAILKGVTGHSLSDWESLKLKWNHCCAICGMQEPFTGQTFQRLTEDHIVPLSKGGSNDISNIQPLCALCNSKKSNKVNFPRKG